MDEALLAHTAHLAKIRARFDVFAETSFFSGNGDVTWLRPDGEPMTVPDWEGADTDALVMVLATGDHVQQSRTRLIVAINRARADMTLRLPGEGRTTWLDLETGLPSPGGRLPARSVAFYVEKA